VLAVSATIVASSSLFKSIAKANRLPRREIGFSKLCEHSRHAYSTQESGNKSYLDRYMLAAGG
jgi:hypothetical protein